MHMIFHTKNLFYEYELWSLCNSYDHNTILTIITLDDETYGFVRYKPMLGSLQIVSWNFGYEAPSNTS